MRVSDSSSQRAVSAKIGDLRRTQRLLLTNKVHVNPGADRHLPADAPFATAWGAGVHLVSMLGGLPDALLTWWADQPNGHILVTAGVEGYAESVAIAGKQEKEERVLTGVAQVPLVRMATDPAQALALALYPLDHLLGCGGTMAGQWLSAGGGISSIWRETGRQVHELFELGYGLTPAAISDHRAYLAEGLVLALTDRRRLNTVDPKLDRLLGATLLNAGFCRHHLSALGKALDRAED